MVKDWLDLGGLSARAHVLSRFRLDGGSMFGSVPKALWGRFATADEQNRIPLVLRALLVRRGDRLLLVDPGLGQSFGREERLRLGVDAALGTAADRLAAIGVSPTAVTDLLLTHLHFDHAGGLAAPAAEGGTAPAFPQARVWLSRAQWDRAQHPTVKERRSYRTQDLECVRAMRFELIEGAREIVPGVRVEPTEGHATGLLVVHLTGEHERLLYPSDLVPTLAHVRMPYTTGFDMWPERLMAEKEALLRQAAESQALVVFNHDPRTAGGRIGVGADGFVMRERIAALS